MLRTLIKVLPNRRGGLEAKLAGVDGFTGRGDISLTIWNSGEKTLDVALRGVAGKTAGVYAGDTLIAEVAIVNGRADTSLHSRKGAVLPDLTPDTRIDVRQNGQAILSGSLTES